MDWKLDGMTAKESRRIQQGAFFNSERSVRDHRQELKSLDASERVLMSIDATRLLKQNSIRVANYEQFPVEDAVPEIRDAMLATMCERLGLIQVIQWCAEFDENEN